MKIFDTQKLRSNTRALLLPVSGVFILGILLVVSLWLGYANINAKIEELNEIESETEDFESKFLSLSRINPSFIDATNSSVIALPDKNSGLFMLAQLRSLSEKHGVNIVSNKVEAGTEYGGNVSSSNIYVEIESRQLNSLINFLQEIQNLAPVSTIESASVSANKTPFVASAQLKVYWSEFPKNLPSLSQPVIELDQNDLELLSMLSKLSKPSFVVLDPDFSQKRSDPFQ